MTLGVNCKEMEVLVRQRIHDVSANTFSATEVLGAIDDVLRHLFHKIRSADENVMLDRIDIPRSSFTVVEKNVLEYELPEYITDPKLIEGITSSSALPYPISQSGFDDKDVARGMWHTSGCRWNWSRWGGPGSIQIRGNSDSLATIRIWYVHNIGPMFYGAAASGSTATSIKVGTVTGAYKNRTGLYAGHMLEVTADTGAGAANLGVVRRITAFDAGACTVATMPGTVSASTQFAIMLPLPGEHMKLIQVMTAHDLLLRHGADEEVMLIKDELADLRSDFEASIIRKSTGEPPRFSSSRRYR